MTTRAASKPRAELRVHSALLLLALACSQTPALRGAQPSLPEPAVLGSAATSAGGAPSTSGGAPSIANGAEGAETAEAEAHECKPSAATADAAGKPEDMLFVPGGAFVMGADDEGEPDERPAHRVSVGSFWLDRTEVTQAAYSECVRAGVCRSPDSLAHSRLTGGNPAPFRRPDHPVVGVSWFDATAYCGFRSKRLPSEAEWEHAARDGDARRYVWGDAAPDPKRHGVFGGRVATEPVGSYPDGRGPYGHLDLAGNVWEWVADEYDPYAYRRPSASEGVPGSCTEIRAALDELRRHHLQGFTGSNPIPTECEHVLRGGAYNYGAHGMRASNRVHHPASFRLAVAGFRCARAAIADSCPSVTTRSSGDDQHDRYEGEERH